MKKLIHLSSFLFLFLISCSDTDKKETPASETDVDAARNFIRAALDGDYKKARTFIVNDTTNTQSIDLYEWNYNNKVNDEDRKKYKAATIRFLDTRKINDSLTIISYSNSFKDKKDSLKVMRVNGLWLVDLNFTFQKNDSLSQ